jgi:predicted adenylyl cyclase CyaB
MWNYFAPAQGLNLGTETEIKIRIEDPEAFCLRLQEFDCRLLAARHFEDNRILDFSDGKLQVSRQLIRIRNADGQGVFTYKGPPLPEGVFKIREELEIKIESAEIALQILEKLGMHVCFRYQKYRREFTANKVTVAVDETPIGNYAEFEGDEADILGLARKMGIDPSEFLRASYYSLYVENCDKKGEPPSFMIF